MKARALSGSALGVIALAVSGCAVGTEGMDTNPEQDIPQVWLTAEQWEQLSFEETTLPDGSKYDVVAEKRDGYKVWGGDMVIGEVGDDASESAFADVAEEVEDLGANIARNVGRWPGGVVPYVISVPASNVELIDNIKYAMRRWNEMAGIVFVPKHGSHRNWVNFKEHASVCNSWVGMRGSNGDGSGEQVINLQFSPLMRETSCGKRNGAMHEIGHALGLLHEHQRIDRADHLDMKGLFQACANRGTVVCQNVCMGPTGSFGPNNGIFLSDICFATDGSNGQYLGDPHGAYDKTSIMHYQAIGRKTYFINGTTPVDGWFNAKPGTTSLAGAGIDISAGDAAAVKFMYRQGSLDGDGKDDLLFVEPGDRTIHTARSNGGGFPHELRQLWIESGGFGSLQDNYFTADFDGDGLTDLGYLESNQSFHVCLSTGSDLCPGGARAWLPAWGFGNTDFKLYKGDYNGDGRDDIAVFQAPANTIKVALSQGDRFAPAQTWIPSNGFGSLKNNYYPADFDGNGLTDLGYFESDGAFFVILSTGTGFGAAGSGRWLDPGYFGGPVTIYTGDFTGDGSEDLMVSRNAYLLLLRSLDNDFATEEYWAQYNGYGWHGERYQVADFTGDGVADLAYQEPLPNGIMQYYVAPSLGSGLGGASQWIQADWGHLWGEYYTTYKKRRIKVK